jgi:RNA polymerase sigma-70 factor (ECF subfamily)
MIDLPQTRQSMIVRLRDPADADAWRAFVDVYGPAVFAFARRNGLQPADAADVTQDVCRNVSGAMRSFQYDADRGRFRGWLFTIVRNQLRMFRRSQARRPRGAELVDDIPDDTAAETWDLECRRRLFAWACERVKPTVAARTWTAFWRTAVDAANGEMVAKETGLSVAAVYLAKSRVLARLRQAIAEIEDESEPPS